MWKSRQDHRGSICGLNIVNYELTQDAFWAKLGLLTADLHFLQSMKKQEGRREKIVKDTSWTALLKKTTTSAFLPLGIPSKTPVKYDV